MSNVIRIPNSFDRLVSCIFILMLLAVVLSGCASSEVSRQGAANVDLGVQNAKNLVSGDGDPVEAYQNANQSSKGVLLGGAAGGVVGALTSGFGFIPGMATGAIMGGAYGKYIDSNTNLRDQLENRGAIMMTLGDQMLVVLPSSGIFNNDSSTINPESYSTLKLTSQYISNYAPMSVKVAGFTNDSGSVTVDKNLSQQQADQVVKFLMESHTNARVIYAKGYGSKQLIERNSGNWNSGNNRIEISFQKLPS